ncbi:MAG: hypothetical protein ACRCUY_13485 [Thermoguttaceae bacterium]
MNADGVREHEKPRCSGTNPDGDGNCHFRATRQTNPPTYIGGSPNMLVKQNNRFLQKRDKHGREFCIVKIQKL